MAYETGVAAGPNDLLDKFRIFAIAQGWTVNRWVSWTYGQQLCISKGSAYFNFQSCQAGSYIINGSNGSNKYGIAINGSDGYSGALDYDKQPGYPVRGTTSGGDQAHVNVPFVLNSGPFASYHFFDPDGTCLYAEIEEITGVFLRFGVGSLALYNPAQPGGQFVYGVSGQHQTNSVDSYNWLGVDADNQNYAAEMTPFRSASYSDANTGPHCASMVRCQVLGYDNWASSGRTSVVQGLPYVCQGGGVHDAVLREFSPNQINGSVLLLPNIVSLRDGAYLYPMGVMPGWRNVNITNYAPKDEITLGADVWKLFPMYQKGGIGYNRGVAILKVS